MAVTALYVRESAVWVSRSLPLCLPPAGLHCDQLEDVSRIPFPQGLIVERHGALLFDWHFPTSLLNPMFSQSRIYDSEDPEG